MKIKITYQEDIAILGIEGKININSSRLIEAVASLLETGTERIVIDMAGVEFVDYNGLSVIAIAYKNALNNHVAVHLCNISLHIKELLRVVKLDDVFSIYGTLKDAINGFSDSKKPTLDDEESIPEQLRRRFMRLDMELPITYRLAKPSNSKNGNHLYSGRMANISGAGVFVRSLHILPPGSEVIVEIALDKKVEPLIVDGIILWTADKELQPDMYPGMGIGFKDFTHRQQEQLIEYIEKHTVHRKE